MDFNVVSKLKIQDSGDESTKEVDSKEQKFYEIESKKKIYDCSPRKNENQIISEKKISLRLMKIISARNIIKKKRYYVHLWRKIIFEYKQTQNSIEKFTQCFKNTVRSRHSLFGNQCGQ